MSDATPAYRGYRRQILYTLSRLMDPQSEGLTFQLEGIEDLDVYDEEGRLFEVVQVKDFSVPLALSHLASRDPQEGSFIHRTLPLLQLSFVPHISLISFGPIGPELTRAYASEGQARRQVARKLTESYDLSAEDAGVLSGAICPVLVEEADLRERVLSSIRNSIVGADPESAFELITQWLYGCAEHKSRLTRHEVVNRVQRVGRFVSRRDAHHSMWFSSIVPIEERAISGEASKVLADEFYRGVAARYDHILANLDAPRREKLAQISAEFTERDAVILHAASGQGKTTLAYRYLKDAAPELWRYQVIVVDGRAHGLQIAAAIEGYADAFEIPILVYIDVSPKDTGWTELVERFARYPRVRVLVTVREEDWRGATFDDTDAIRDVELTFDQNEAEQIFGSLAATRAPAAFLNFEDAWSDFRGDGPLLEFVYLVTQGGLLRERLHDQVSRIKRDVNRGQRGAAELDLLRLVSVAAAYGGRLRVSSVARRLKLPALDEAIVLLEKEYLVRITESGALLDGLHPIRSEILAELLTDDDTAPWSEAAIAVLGLLDERDIGTFLLYCFSRRETQAVLLLEALKSFHPSSWVGIVGVLRALLWLGLRLYAEANSGLLDDARKDSGTGWLAVLDTDFVDAMPGFALSVSEMAGSFVSIERRRQIEALQARQTSKADVFIPTITWLRLRIDQPETPSSADDWAAVAEVAYWVRHLGVEWPQEQWLPPEKIGNALRDLPLDVAADLVVALADHQDGAPPPWLETEQGLLRERFQRETATPVLEDAGEKLTAHFIIGPGTSADELTDTPDFPFLDARNPLHNKALVRVDLMRRLFPDRGSYASQGYGHRTGSLELPNDDTRKPGIPRGKLPLRWDVSVNATFAGIVDYAERPSDWEEYAERVIGIREEVLRCLIDLYKALPTYLRSTRSIRILGRSIPSTEWFRSWTMLRDPPRLPRCAVDEWGFVTESLTDASSDPVRVQGRTGLGNIPTVRRYRPVLEPLRRYTNAWHNFLLQSPGVMKANVGLQKATGGAHSSVLKNLFDRLSNEGDRRLSTLNLADAWKALHNLQQEHRRVLGIFVDARRLQRLEQREIEYFDAVWPLWYAFAKQPNRILRDPIQESKELLANTIRRLEKALRRELVSSALNSVCVPEESLGLEWEGEPALWLTIDGTDGVAVYDTLLPVLETVRRAIQNVEDSPLRRYALDFRWRSVVVVPLIRGRSLAGMAWRVNTHLLVRVSNAEQLGFWHFLPEPVPAEAFLHLGLSVWNDVRLLAGLNLSEATSNLWQLITHMQDLANLPELQGVGEEIGLKHVERMFERVNLALQETENAATGLKSAVSAAIETEPDDKTGLKLAFEAVQALIEVAIPADGAQGRISLTMKVSDMTSWSNRLLEGLRYGHIAHLAWASFILSSHHDSDGTHN